MLNAVVFESEDEVLLHFREALSNGQFLVDGEPPKEASGDNAYSAAMRQQFVKAVSQLDETAKKVLARVVEHDSINEFNLIQEFGQGVRDHLHKIENLGIIDHFVKEGEPRLHWRIKDHVRQPAKLFFSESSLQYPEWTSLSSAMPATFKFAHYRNFRIW